MIKYGTFVFAVLAATVHSASLPSTIKTCKQSDGDFKTCLNEAIEGALGTLSKGNKELGVPKIDPLFIKSIHISGSGDRVNLEQTFTDLNIYGLSQSKIESNDVDLKECKIAIDAITEKVELKSDFKVSGKLLLFSLNGHGKSVITLSNMKSHIVMPCEREEKDGKNHLKFQDVTVQLQPEKLNFEIENLIDGNEQLSAEVLKVMNENDMEIFQELKKDYENTFSQIFMQLANNLFAKVPEEDVFPQ